MKKIMRFIETNKLWILFSAWLICLGLIFIPNVSYFLFEEPTVIYNNSIWMDITFLFEQGFTFPSIWIFLALFAFIIFITSLVLLILLLTNKVKNKSPLFKICTVLIFFLFLLFIISAITSLIDLKIPYIRSASFFAGFYLYIFFFLLILIFTVIIFKRPEKVSHKQTTKQKLTAQEQQIADLQKQIDELKANHKTEE